MKEVKSRDWTEMEVRRAVAEIQREPGLWEELERIEKATGEFRDSDAADKELGILTKLHPECSLHEITQLYVAVRKYRRDLLGLK